MLTRHATVFAYTPRGGPLAAHPVTQFVTHWAITPEGLAPAPSAENAHGTLRQEGTAAWFLPRNGARIEAEGRAFGASLQLHDRALFCLVHGDSAAWGCFSLDALPWHGPRPPEAPCHLCGRPLGEAPALHCGRCGRAFHDGPERRCLATLGTCSGCMTPYDPTGALRVAPRWG
jgi:hypothetical protein